jgi:hypothetical protein
VLLSPRGIAAIPPRLVGDRTHSQG